ncbi:MAG: hypothetical protein SGJ01_02395 [Gemmatimonadota bacterium]|nr:hypothetical protein [Gemmatimonadota bacterium]
MQLLHVTSLTLVLMLAACGKKPEAAQAPAADSVGTMGGMQMAMQGMTMMPLMRAHLDSLGALPPAGMAAVMSAHQDLASRMMDAMGADMRGMNMQPDSAWAALTDSLRQDLADLPGLSAGALSARMPAHIGRMRRMMALHEGMMKM